MPNEYHLRSTEADDRAQVSALLQTAGWRHQHSDWFHPLDLLDQKPSIIAFKGNLALGWMACPPDPPEVAWIRGFAAAPDLDLQRMWEVLWQRSMELARGLKSTKSAALVVSDWIMPLLHSSGYQQTNSVIFLEWIDQPLPIISRETARIRPFTTDDLTSVATLDQESFHPIWSHTEEMLSEAIMHTAHRTVIEEEGTIVGYQLSTYSALGAHIARLAVHPGWQGRGLGRLLVADILKTFSKKGIDRVSVNTQADNDRSRQLYRAMGFQETGQTYPFFECDLLA